MKAADWIAFCGTLAPYALRDLLPPTTLSVFFRFCETVSVMTDRRVVLPDDADRVHQLIVETMCLMERYYPISEQTICFHLLSHVGWYMQRWGSLANIWMFPAERFNGFLVNAIQSRSHPEANLTRFYQIFSTTQRYRRELQTVMTSSAAGQAYAQTLDKSNKVAASGELAAPRYLQLQPELLGKSKAAKLSVQDQKQLVAMFRREFARFGELKAAYEQDRKAAEADGVFPLMDTWRPTSLRLTAADRKMLRDPVALLQFKRATVGGVQFVAEAAERRLKSRSSFFEMPAIDKRGNLHRNFGRLLLFYRVQFAGAEHAVAKVELYERDAKDAVMCPPVHGVVTDLPVLDTRKLIKDRQFILLRSVQSKIALLPPDDRLKKPPSQRLVGKCFVVTCANCVAPRSPASDAPHGAAANN